MNSRGFRLVLLITVGAACVGCEAGATLVREAPNGGLVTYMFQQESDVLASSGRRDALKIMSTRCPNGFLLVREGEVPKVSAAADRAWRGQMGYDRQWGMQFECK